MSEYFQVMLISKGDKKEKVKDLTEEKLLKSIVEPYRKGETIFVNGTSINSLTIERIHIRQTSESYRTISDRLYEQDRIARERHASNGILDLTPSHIEPFWSGTDVLDRFIHGPAGYKADRSTEPKSPKSVSNKIFLVHGHNEEMKQSVARLLEKLGFEPIILHEQPNMGRTIIEKFSDYSDVGYAIVLLSADDLAHSKHEGPEREAFRARQNVILELGYFLGRLGRDRVLALFEDQKNIEIPSDFSGVLYVGYGGGDSWRFSIAKELKASGFEVDMNKIAF